MKEKIINLAVIAHVDAGKSTLVDAFLDQSGLFNKHQQLNQLVMDSNDLERERGITIYSKNCSVMYEDYKINIVDTPGHADFSSEVERIMNTVDTVILLVDSAEGPMPQTRFVLKKALESGLNPILLINKIDKKEARVDEVIDLVYELFVDLNANDEQLEFPILYGIAREGIVQNSLDQPSSNLEPLFKTIINHVQPYPDLDDQPLQLQISSLAYDDYVGRIGIGRIFSGTISKGQTVTVVSKEGQNKGNISNLFVYDGLTRKAVNKAVSGDIVLVSGIDHIFIGDTINEFNKPNPLPMIEIEEPTLSMNFSINSSPFAGQSGKYVTSRNIRERLTKELEVNVGLVVEETDLADTFVVSGRGELHLTILVENMRREGYELSLGKPQVIYHIDENGHKQEPIEEVFIEVSEEFSGSVISKLSLRKGELVDMSSEGSMVSQSWKVPTRGLLGYRSQFINDTKGQGTLVRRFLCFEDYKGEIETNQLGSMISNAQGVAMTYALNNLQERGQLMIGAQTPVYEGMVVGISAREDEMEVNPTKNKKATAIRSDGHDEAMRLTPPLILTLEKAIELIKEDELVEVTPDAIRIRKKYLKASDRKLASRKEQ